MSAKAVSNSSPPIYLYRLGLLDILPQLYAKVLVPRAVISEHGWGRDLGFQTPDLSRYEWVEIKETTILPEFAELPHLQQGELEALSLAKMLPDSVVLMDEARGRIAARRHGIKTAGTLALLSQAKEVGAIEQVRPFLEQLVAMGFRLSPQAIQEVLKGAGEA